MQQGLKPSIFTRIFGTTEVVPGHKASSASILQAYLR